MPKKTNEWKEYIKEAKTRLLQSKFQPVDDEVFILNSRKLNRQDIARLNCVISEVLASDEFVSNPLGKLIEEDVYNNLSEDGKMRYLLDLSSIYLALRAKFNK